MMPSRSAVIALALAAMTMTTTARAEPPAAPEAIQTPLTLAPGKPLALEGPPASSGLGWKIAGLLLTAGVGAWLVLQRGTRPKKARPQPVSVLARVAVGAKADVVVIELEGQRLVLGVTPQTITSLFVLPEIDAEDVAAAAPEAPPIRAVALLDARDEAPEPVRPQAARRVADLERQARGLLTIRSRE